MFWCGRFSVIVCFSFATERDRHLSYLRLNPQKKLIPKIIVSIWEVRVRSQLLQPVQVVIPGRIALTYSMFADTPFPKVESRNIIIIRVSVYHPWTIPIAFDTRLCCVFIKNITELGMRAISPVILVGLHVVFKIMPSVDYIYCSIQLK